MALNKVVNTIMLSNRKKKHNLFMKLFKPTDATKILDIGYSDEPTYDFDSKNYLEKSYPYLNNITALGIQKYGHQVYHNDLSRGGNEFKTVTYNGKIFPFNDKSFDIGFSNAVIEHVGNEDAQIFFVKEICRVCKSAFLTTPNKFFPIETHTKYPFIHWLPDNLFFKIISKTKYRGLVSELRLLSEHSLKKILDAANLKGKYRIYKQRFFGFNMTLTIEIIC